MTDQAEAPDPETNLTPEAKRFRNDLSPASRARLDRNLADDTTKVSSIGSIATDFVRKAETARRARVETPEEPPKGIHETLIALSTPMNFKHQVFFPRALVATPEFNSLSAMGLRTLNALFLFRDRKNGIAWPGHRAILISLGMHPESDSDRRQLKRGITELIRAGLIWLKFKGKEKHASEYFVAQNKEHIAFIRSITTGQPTSPTRPRVGDEP